MKESLEIFAFAEKSEIEKTFFPVFAMESW